MQAVLSRRELGKLLTEGRAVVRIGGALVSVEVKDPFYTRLEVRGPGLDSLLAKQLEKLLLKQVRALIVEEEMAKVRLIRTGYPVTFTPLDAVKLAKHSSLALVAVRDIAKKRAAYTVLRVRHEKRKPRYTLIHRGAVPLREVQAHVDAVLAKIPKIVPAQVGPLLLERGVTHILDTKPKKELASRKRIKMLVAYAKEFKKYPEPGQPTLPTAPAYPVIVEAVKVKQLKCWRCGATLATYKTPTPLGYAETARCPNCSLIIEKEYAWLANYTMQVYEKTWRKALKLIRNREN